MTTHRTCNHARTSTARAACRRERATAADILRERYAHVLAKRVLFGLDDCDVCEPDLPHARHYGLVRDVIADARYLADPTLVVWDEEAMRVRNINLSMVEFVN